jgi:hypothetical protein
MRDWNWKIFGEEVYVIEKAMDWDDEERICMI